MTHFQKNSRWKFCENNQRPNSQGKVTSVKASTQSSSYLSVGQAARFLSVSASQIRLMVERQELEAFTLASGHRRISAKSVKLFASGGEGQTDVESEIVGYCRTSSRGQFLSLSRQIERLRQEIGAREGIDPTSVKIYQECCSSFGERAVLQQLVLDTINGKIRKIYVEHYNRLTRVKALGTMLEFLTDHFGATIIALDREESVDELANNLQELVDFVHVLGCKQASEKSKLVTVVHLPIEVMERIAFLGNSGMTQREIYRTITAEGHKTLKGNKIAYSKVRQVILLNGNLKTAIGIEKTEQTNLDSLLRNWVGENIENVEGGKLTVSQITKKYNAYAKEKNLAVQNPTTVGKTLVKIGLRATKSHGQRFIANVSFKA